MLAAVLLGLSVTIIAGHTHHPSGPPTPRLPASPRQWVEQWTDASIENPTLVCRRLFAPALASAFRPDTGRTCLSYYSSVTSSSFRVRRVMQNGNAAAVEVHQVGAKPTWGYFTVLLSHVRGGWQAIDIVPGGPIRPR